jgi:hypothetical protein
MLNFTAPMDSGEDSASQDGQNTIAFSGMTRRRLHPLQLIRRERRVQWGGVFDGEVVAGSLVDEVENFLKWHGGVGVAELQRDGDDREFVAQCPGINFTLRPTLRAADDAVVVSRWQCSDRPGVACRLAAGRVPPDA